jgi:hypothetical protein
VSGRPRGTAQRAGCTCVHGSGAVRALGVRGTLCVDGIWLVVHVRECVRERCGGGALTSDVQKAPRGEEAAHSTQHAAARCWCAYVHLDESEREIAQPSFHTHLQKRRYCSMLGGRCTTAGDERRLSAKTFMSAHCSRLR